MPIARKVKPADIKAELTAERIEPVYKNSELLSSGSYMMNLACTGRLAGAFPKGKVILLVGDSASGKTWTTLSCFAESRMKAEFKDHIIILDSTSEDGAGMDIEAFFGKDVAKDIIHVNSHYTEQFYARVDDLVKEGKPFIYVLDSENGLESLADDAKFEENKKLIRKGKAPTGSFGTKPKQHSSSLLRLKRGVKDTGSIVIIISQTRDRIGFGAQYDPKTRSGGNALTFFADLEIWTSSKGMLTRMVRGKPRQIGIICEAKVRKNRVNGRRRVVRFPIYWSYGIDNTGSLIDYLVEEGYWTTKGAESKSPTAIENKTINATEFGVVLKRDKLVQFIEQNDKEQELRSIVKKVWNEIEDACIVRRKRRYA